MKVAIIENEQIDINNLTNLIDQYNNNHSTHVNYDCYKSINLFFDKVQTIKYDVAFFDIYTNENIDGIQASKTLHSHNPSCLIIFISSSVDDIWRAVSTHYCFDYIRKNELNYLTLKSLLNKIDDMTIKSATTIEFKVGKIDINLKIANIMYVTSNNKYTKITLKNNLDYSYRINFSIICDLLCNENNFIICNRGILLNMNYINKTDKEIFVMDNNHKFPIRRSDRLQLVETYNNYLFSKLDSIGDYYE